MADSITAGSITNSAVTLSYEIDNSGRGYSVYASIFVAPAGLSFSQIEAAGSTYIKQNRTVGPGNTLSSSITVTGLSANTSYTYMMSVTTVAQDFSTVIYRRPTNPPGTFTTYGPPVYTDSSVKSTGTVNVFYSDGVSASNATSYSISTGSLPPGLSLSSNTGSITGTPTTAGSYSFRVSANNSWGSTLTGTLSITIAPAAPVWIDQTIYSPAYEDAPYSDAVSATNSAKYRISSGSLPAGITLGTATGSISGTPTTPGTANFTVQAYNTSGTVSVGLTLEVISGLAPPSWTDNTLSDALRVGSAYADKVTATDASSYAVVGTIVPGLTLNTTNGSVTGTPIAQGTYDFDIRAINAAGTATASFELSVDPSVRRYDGSGFQWASTLKRWDGSAWVDIGFVRRWNGSAWENADG